MTPPRTRFHPFRPLLTGMLALLPLAATLLLLVWAARLAAEWLGPQSGIGSILIYLGVGVAASPVWAYVAGIVILLAGVYGVGLLVEAGLQRGVDSLLQSLMRRIPVVRTVYDVAQRLVGLIGTSREDGMKSMQPVWLHFGGPPAPGEAGNTAVLALQTTHEAVLLGGAPYHGVLVPTAPVPVGGGLLFVPAHWVLPADVGIEGVTSIYVSMGVTANQYLGPKGAPPSRSRTPGQV
ncbi:DUF502 domain-containing protein [Ottowia testudinis]|uniref:DUF502 domain-containing protein n=1 Tax=Ottowia testudinis TaxID=2816950 RepID=A0A975CH98_9BURK|nr:DUF502 domain-containing protein [Ottowia testudinis]QTD44159.1 DUF502 domain-containing protein [Ottowia testudinis]